MTFEPLVASPASLGIFAGVFLGALFGLHLKNRIPGLRFPDSLRAVLYVTQYAAALEYHGLRRHELRARVDELRANLRESAADGGAAAAIQRLGPPRVLATEVAGFRMVPSWIRGTLWLAAATAAGVFALVMTTSAFLSAVQSAVPPGDTATWSTFFVTMTATSVQDNSPICTIELPFATLALLLVPFGLGARAWRIWTGRHTHRVSAHGH